MFLGHWIPGSCRAGVVERGKQHVRTRVAPATCLERAFRPWWWCGTQVEPGSRRRGRSRLLEFTWQRPGGVRQSFQLWLLHVLGETTQQWRKYHPKEGGRTILRGHTVPGIAGVLPSQSGGVNTSELTRTWVDCPGRSCLNSRTELALD